MLENIDEPLK